MAVGEEKLWNKNYLKVWSANFLLYFSFMLLTPLLPLYLSEVYGADKDTIGLVLSGYVVAAMLVRPFSGYFIDSFPRKRVLLISYALACCFFTGYLAAGSLLLFALVRTLHGTPYGATTVSLSTVAIDVLPSSRRGEGIGYYGLSNNIATAISPSVALLLYEFTKSYQVLFIVALVTAAAGVAVAASLDLPARPLQNDKKAISLDRFLLTKGWSEALGIIFFSFSYGVVSTYVAIYGKEELDITGGSGIFFALFAIGLIISRLTGGKSLGRGRVVENAGSGILVSLVGYLLFAALHNDFGYYASALIIGLGNGHMYPAFQTMFINLGTHNQRGTANSTILTSWDLGCGLGVLAGGFLAEAWGYHVAFWAAWVVNGLGVLSFFLYSKNHFLKNKLR